jgi:hypothetical protein
MIASRRNKEDAVTHDTIDLEHSEGAQQMQAVCYAISAALGLDLEVAEWRWLWETPTGSTRYGLYVKAPMGSADCWFTGADIEGYLSGLTTAAVQATIRAELEDLLRSPRRRSGGW